MKFMLKLVFLILTFTSAYAGPSKQSAASDRAQKLIIKARIELMEQLKKQKYTQLHITPKSRQVSPSLSLSNLKIQIKDRYPPLKQICVRLSDGKHSSSVWFKIKAYQRVLVAKNSIKSRTILSTYDFIIENKNVAGLKSAPFQQVPVQAWLKKSISKGTILTEAHLKTKPDIVKDQSVQVHIKSQGITVSAEAIAQHDGYSGHAIKIKNPRSNTSFRGVVIAPNEVEVRV
jgi:flagella basal body P-ring formation protein FlgA